MIAFHELSTAAYCARKLYYARQQDEFEIPDEVPEKRDLAYRYEELLGATDRDLAELSIELPPGDYRTNLERECERHADAWPELADPTDGETLLSGRECRGYAHKILALDSPVPSLLFTGEPPPDGVWGPHSVRAVAAAKALAWECETPVERAFVEYPAHGKIREVRLTTRRKAHYRRIVRTVDAIDGPPPRLKNRSKCEECEFKEECGVKTRSLRSLLGL